MSGDLSAVTAAVASVGPSSSSSSDVPSSSSSVVGGPAGLPKLREILRRQRPESEDEESPDIEFVYSDSDVFSGEMAEFYSYTENPEFTGIQKSFQECMDKFGINTSWRSEREREENDPCSIDVIFPIISFRSLSVSSRVTAIHRLLDQTEVSDTSDRLSATRALLYIAQGCWLECQSDAECTQVRIIKERQRHF